MNLITKDHKTHSLLTKRSQYITKQVCCVSSAVCQIQTGLNFSYSTAWPHTDTKYKNIHTYRGQLQIFINDISFDLVRQIHH